MADRLTLLDIAKQSDPDGGPAQVAEVLSETNPILQDAPAYAANAPTGNRVTLRSALPTVDFTRINQGVVRSKGATKQAVDTIGLIAGLSEVDSKLRRIVGAANFDAARKNEDDGFLESISQLLARTMFYGDELTNEAAFTGLMPRMNALATAITGSQVIGGGAVGGQTDVTSMYIVDWGERACHLIYPENSTAGIETRDRGEQRVTDVDGNPMMAFVTAYDVSLGLTVKDPRHIARVANCDISVQTADTTMALGLLLIDALNSMAAVGGNTRVIYTHRLLVAAFYKQAINKSNAALSIRDYLGKPTPYFWDVPIRRCDEISASETIIT